MRYPPPHLRCMGSAEHGSCSIWQHHAVCHRRETSVRGGAAARRTCPARRTFPGTGSARKAEEPEQRLTTGNVRKRPSKHTPLIFIFLDGTHSCLEGPLFSRIIRIAPPQFCSLIPSWSLEGDGRHEVQDRHVAGAFAFGWLCAKRVYLGFVGVKAHKQS